MARRSVKITLSNKTPFELTLLKDGVQLCHGEWTDDIKPPDSIPPGTNGGGVVSWQSESMSGGIFTGTEGWVKYVIPPDPEEVDQNSPAHSKCPGELLYIYWNNPFVWDDDTRPIGWGTHMEDITPPCDEDEGKWNVSLGNPSQNCRRQLFAVTDTELSGGIRGLQWVHFMPTHAVFLFQLFAFADDQTNLEFTFGLRQQGSVSQSIRSFYDGKKGLRSLASTAGQSSLRKLFHL